MLPASAHEDDPTLAKVAVAHQSLITTALEDDEVICLDITHAPRDAKARDAHLDRADLIEVQGLKA